MKRIEFETFRRLGDFQRRSLEQGEPSCWNGEVNVKKMRVVFEEIEEPDEVIRARIQKLWDECDNHHHRDPLRAVAKKYGLDL